jgi:hypothetical protein
MAEKLKDLNENFEIYLQEMFQVVNQVRDDRKLKPMTEPEFRELFIKVGFADSPYFDEKQKLKPMSELNYQLVIQSAFNKVLVSMLESIPLEVPSTQMIHDKLKKVDRLKKWDELNKYFGE